MEEKLFKYYNERLCQGKKVHIRAEQLMSGGYRCCTIRLGTAGRALSEAFIPKIKQVKQTCHRVKTKETLIQPIFINCL